MKLYICVDDTDDLTKSTSTGKISDLIARRLEELGGVLEKGITRHQLLLHEDIEYTSHNSSMCMVMDMENIEMEKIKTAAEEILKANMAETSDPGLCFCRLDQLKEPDRLIAYGKRAQKEVIQKQEAYDLADQIGGTILEEYGGTGIGVIGALAGVGLRLSGCDGTFRGGKGSKYAGQTYSAAQWKTMMGIEQVLDFQGRELADTETVSVDKQLKLAMLDHKKTLIAELWDGAYIACTKKDLYQGDKRISTWTTSCENFQADNDAEECYSESENACYNCLYRRWTANGFICVK
ncbi:hypothetical protein NE619_02825 [Anaerovorax odorimutans]|uniref:tRNA(Ile2) 2-agmatinylcytidine synthetase n=1 Tax=Anaerovorax odorimutans TaxID=109327 RepID=A0ABT1RKE0_9FIRM|nr:hypothetical protein [Anaerovorax odorimutans]MCQ4635650.1 hypothetical protein [Anaerovorax odorimutans]